MKFTVNFYTKSLFSNPVTINNQITPDDIDFIREQSGSDLPLEKIGEPCYKFHLEPEIAINEETARSIDNFRQIGNYIKVAVPASSLDKYIYKGVYVEKDLMGKNITVAGLEYTLDKEKIISDWIEDGAPMEWGIPTKKFVIEYGKNKGLIDKIKDLFKF